MLAAGLTEKPTLRASAWILRRVFKAVKGLSDSARETVEAETPASLAKS